MGGLIRRQQALEAKRLLAWTDPTVRRVAGEAGFADPAYFCRFFRREHGMAAGPTGRSPAPAGRVAREARLMPETERSLSVGKRSGNGRKRIRSIFVTG
ncbi:helix-turn-helix domain-containing protein [Kitasatospora cathayae]|uniref:helix-turn-helix domain-containing protein n=1 Tax=Kitasatospora cathayae TaxID=3004092 RepID=UPI003860168E